MTSLSEALQLDYFLGKVCTKVIFYYLLFTIKHLVSTSHYMYILLSYCICCTLCHASDDIFVYVYYVEMNRLILCEVQSY